MSVIKAPRLYGKWRIRRILARQESNMHRICAEYRLPCPCLMAVVEKELSEMDVLDRAADLAVLLYWAHYALFRHPLPHGKRDSSTGYGQVFAATAIRAVRLAVEKGWDDCAALGLDHLPEAAAPDDLRRIWLRLHRNVDFNLRMAALTLLAAAEEVNGSADFSRFTPEQLMRAFSRYNANTHAVTSYGEAVYRLYLDRLTAEQNAA